MADNICTCTTPQYTVTLNTQGPPGKQGNPGVDGFSPVITVNTNTETTYTLNILTEDGMITTPNLKSSLPSGGTNGQVLTNTGNGNYTWNDIPQSTPQGQGIIRISTDADFVPDDEGNLDDTTAVTPQRLKDYIGNQGFATEDYVISQGYLTEATLNNFKYLPLTSSEYAVLTPAPDTLYRLTDTNDVYLGNIKLTGGGGSALYQSSILNNYNNATQTNLDGSTTLQVTNTEV